MLTKGGMNKKMLRTFSYHKPRGRLYTKHGRSTLRCDESGAEHEHLGDIKWFYDNRLQIVYNTCHVLSCGKFVHGCNKLVYSDVMDNIMLKEIKTWICKVAAY